MDKYCQNCNKPNPVDAAFCRHCASSQFHPINPPTAQAQQAGQFGNQAWTPGPGGLQGSNFGQAPVGDGASGRAIASMILAIAALVLCCGIFTGVPAAILGWMEIAAIKEGRSSQKGLIMAQIGMWGGIAVSALSVLGWGVYLLLVVAGGMM